MPPPGQPPGLPHNPPSPQARRRPRLKDPLSVVLIVVIVVALGLAGLLGGELFARNVANTVLARAVSCIVQDSATASFGLRPFLLQHLTHSYSGVSVETAGNQIREAKGMKLTLRLDDVRLKQTADSQGTLGALDADVTWSTDGIKETVAGIVPIFGGLVNGVTTEPTAGTIELQGGLGTVTVRPQVADGGLALEVVGLTGLGFTLPSETVQPALDAFTTTLTRNLPMGLHADSVAVTSEGVTARFVTRDAPIPTAQQDPCFAGL